MKLSNSMSISKLSWKCNAVEILISVRTRKNKPFFNPVSLLFNITSALIQCDSLCNTTLVLFQ